MRDLCSLNTAISSTTIWVTPLRARWSSLYSSTGLSPKYASPASFKEHGHSIRGKTLAPLSRMSIFRWEFCYFHGAHGIHSPKPHPSESSTDIGAYRKKILNIQIPDHRQNIPLFCFCERVSITSVSSPWIDSIRTFRKIKSLKFSTCSL